MVTRFGMHDALGQVTYETPRQTFLGEDALAHYAEREFSEATAREIDCAVRELIGAAYEGALGILRQNRKALEDGARLLLEKETLTREQLPPLADTPTSGSPPRARRSGEQGALHSQRHGFLRCVKTDLRRTGRMLQ